MVMPPKAGSGAMSVGKEAWQRASAVGRIYIIMGGGGVIYFAVAYVLFLLYASDPIFWTLVFVPFGMGLTGLLFVEGVLIIRRYGGTFCKTFMFSWEDAMKVVEVVLGRLGIGYETEGTRFNWILLLRPRSILRIKDSNVRIEIYGSRGQTCWIRVGSPPRGDAGGVERILRELDEASKPSFT